MGRPAEVTDSLRMNPVANVIAVRNSQHPAQALGMGILQNIMGALKKLSEENRELKSELARMKENASFNFLPSDSFRSGQSAPTVNVDPKRMKARMPVD